MEALVGYASDDSSNDSSEKSGPLTDERNASKSEGSLVSLSAVLPPPQTNIGWVKADHDSHLSQLLFYMSKEANQSNPPSMTSSSSSPAALSLAEQLRLKKEFRNPKHMEQTVQTLCIPDPYGSLFASPMIFQDWEQNIIGLEEQARARQTMDFATEGANASDFVQDQISRALGRGHATT